MIELQFVNPQNRHVITVLTRISDHVIAVNCGEQNTTGFAIYVDGKKGATYYDYKTIYRATDDLVYFSNDGSKYIEPTTRIEAKFDSTEDIPSKVKVKLSDNSEHELLRDSFFIIVDGNVSIVDAEVLDKNWHAPEIQNGATIFYKHKTETELIQEEIAELKQYLYEMDKLPAQLSDIEINARYRDHKTESEIEKLREEFYKSKAEDYAKRDAARIRIKELENSLEVK